MEVTSSAVETTTVVEIPISSIKVNTRLRATDHDKVRDIAESVEGLGRLLHPICVSNHGDEYHLLSGLHRLESFKYLKRRTIPATIQEADPLLEELIEVEENLVSAKLSAIDEARFIVRWEDILKQLGRRAKTGDNRWNRSALTSKDLAKSRGMSRATYLYTKSIANLHPEVQDLLNETDWSQNKMDLVNLAKEKDAVQLEVAFLLTTGECSSFKRALTLSRIKHHPFNWKEEQTRVKDLIGKPFSVQKFNGNSSDLSRLCKLVSEDESCKITKHQWGTQSSPLAAMHADHAAYFINYYSEPGSKLLDPFCGRGTLPLVAAALGRKVVAYDLSSDNLEKIKDAALQHTGISSEDLTLHHSCGVALDHYKDDEDTFDLIISDPPFLFGVEQYGEDPRDLCQVKTVDGYVTKMTECLTNLKRLIKPSCWETKEFHPIVLKVGSGRRGEMGLIDLATEFELIARGLDLVLHDKLINVLDSQWGMFNVSRCIDHKYSVKVHETCLVLVKYNHQKDPKD